MAPACSRLRLPSAALQAILVHDTVETRFLAEMQQQSELQRRRAQVAEQLARRVTIEPSRRLEL